MFASYRLWTSLYIFFRALHNQGCSLKFVSLKQVVDLHKNFWFYHFCCILALETVESSYLFYSQPVFFNPIQ